VARAERTIEIRAPTARVLEVITDFERYPGFVPFMERTEVLAASDGQWRVRFTLNLIRRIRYVLDLTRTDESGLTWTLVDGPFRRNDGGWRLEPLGVDRTRATYCIDVSISGWLPAAVERRLVAESLPATLDAFRAEAEKILNPPA